MSNIKTILLFVLVGFYCTISAQNNTGFDNQIMKLNQLGKKMMAAQDDGQKYEINEAFSTLLEEVLIENTSFDYDFKDLKTISVLKENDLKIYNWVLQLIDGTYRYFGWLQLRKGKEYEQIELTDKSDEIKSPEYAIGNEEKWYGALYYKIIYTKSIGATTYTLLGWDGNNLLTNKKLIEVVTINENGVEFGASIFKTKGKKAIKKRIIFEYAESSVMSLSYHEKDKKIVFNQLHPMRNDFVGVYEYYVPSLNNFDAYMLQKDKWLLEKQITITNEKSIKDAQWENPNK